jgi:hypothetical protein
MLADVDEAFGDDVVRSHLERLLKPSVEVDQQPDGERGTGDDRLESHFQPMPAQHGRVDSLRDVPEFLERECDLLPRLIETSLGIRVGPQPLFEQAELQRKGDEPLLRAVMEIPLEALPLFLAGSYDTRA